MAHDVVEKYAAFHDAAGLHLGTMSDPPPALMAWATMMARRYGELVQVGNAGKAQHGIETGWVDLSAFKKDWLTALLTVVYGEATEFWPSTWTDDLLLRAESWAKGDTPKGVVYPSTDS